MPCSGYRTCRIVRSVVSLHGVKGDQNNALVSLGVVLLMFIIFIVSSCFVLSFGCMCIYFAISS